MVVLPNFAFYPLPLYNLAIIMLEQSHLKGRVFGAVLLVSGCCIGAGMLGLPLVTGVAGFFPSLLMFFLSWLFMAVTGLLLLEVNLWYSGEENMVSLAEKTLGFPGKALSWLLFAFLFYSLMVAYVSGSGELISGFTETLVGYSIPEWSGKLAVSALFAYFVYSGTALVDGFNRFLMLGLVAAYLLLVATGLPHIHPEYLAYTDWPASLFLVPVMVISFGYHNLIPSLKTYLQRDRSRLKRVVLIGSALPLLVYLLWELVILGLVPVEGEGGFKQAAGGSEMATLLLRKAVGSSWIVDIAHYFAFFAVVTSFLSVALSFLDFLADGTGIEKRGKGKAALSLLSVGPPFLFSLVYPKAFLVALTYAGAFGAVILFGILPALMVWNGRYRMGMPQTQIVPGGRGVLIGVILFSLAVVMLEISHQWG